MIEHEYKEHAIRCTEPLVTSTKERTESQRELYDFRLQYRDVDISQRQHHGAKRIGASQLITTRVL